jgi:hypothetical protein
LSGFTAGQRNFIRREAFALLCQEQPLARWKAALPSGIAIGLGFALGMLLSHTVFNKYPLLVTMICGVVGGGVGWFTSGQWLTGQLRPCFRRIVDERSDKILRVT